MLSLNKTVTDFLKGDIVMANVCMNCGKKIGTFSMESPFEVSNGIFLCAKCANPIRHKIGNLYGLKSESEFATAKNEIILRCQSSYSDTVVTAIEQRINSIYQNDVKPQIEREKNKPNEMDNSSAQSELKRLAEERAALKKAADSQMLTTGYDFSGYKIINYMGVISGEVVLGTGFLSEFSASLSDLFGDESTAFADKLETAKKAALEKLTLNSVKKGGNAIIGIDFDYITFSNNMIGVVANGTSVVIEKIE